MNFIDNSKQNVKKYTSSFKERKKSTLSLKEVSGGSVGGFVGGKGMGIDALFAGPFHPDYNEVEQTLKKQLKDRKKQRAKMEKDAGDNYTGTPDPIGGYYETDTKFAKLAYEELELRNQLAIEFSIENTPLSDTEWKSTGWDYDYDEPGEGYSFQQPIYDKKSEYAGENFINKSDKNWEIIKGI